VEDPDFLRRKKRMEKRKKAFRKRDAMKMKNRKWRGEV
jgi:hypothetical protein